MANKKNRRKSIRSFFITISDLNPELQTKEKVLERLLKEENFLSHYLIASQNHTKENSIHFHIYLKYSKAREYGPNHFDYLADKHPNIQEVKSKGSCLLYCTKEDKKPLCNFDYENQIYKTDFLKKVAELLDQGITEEKIFFLNTEQSIKHHAKISSYVEKKKKQEYTEKLKSYPPITEIPIPINATSEDKIILEEFNKAIKYKGDRPRKKEKALYLWSKRGNTGKTLLLDLFKDLLPSYNFPRDAWFPGYLTGEYFLIIWNEVTFIGFDMDFLLTFLEGFQVDLRVKGSDGMKKDHPLILMTSNKALIEILMKKYGKKAPCGKCDHCHRSWHCRQPIEVLDQLGQHYLPLIKLRIKQVEIKENYDLFPLIHYVIDYLKPDPERIKKVKEILEPIEEHRRLIPPVS